MLSNNKIIKVVVSAGGKVAEQATTKPQNKGLNLAGPRHHTKMERKTETMPKTLS